MPLSSLELLANPAGDGWVRRDWDALRAAGLPSQADHRSPTNAPHVTLVAAPELSEEVRGVAVEALEPLVPVVARVGGVLLLGRDPVVLARPVELPDAVVGAVARLRAGVPDRDRDGWVPHLTLAARLPRADLARALEVLDPEPREVRLTRLRWWDPATRTNRYLLG